MATTTATITLASSDLLSDPISFSTTTELTQAGNATGLTGTAGLARKTVSGGHAQYTLFDGQDYTFLDIIGSERSFDSTKINK